DGGRRWCSGDRAGRGGPVPALRAGRGRGGRGERTDADPARRDRLRHRAGLPLQPAAVVRPAGGLVRSEDRARADLGRRGGTAAARGAVTRRLTRLAIGRVVVYSYPGAFLGGTRRPP